MIRPEVVSSAAAAPKIGHGLGSTMWWRPGCCQGRNMVQLLLCNWMLLTSVSMSLLFHLSVVQNGKKP